MCVSANRGFTLIELISVMILVGVLSVTLVSRLGNVHSASVQSSRDDLIAALFFAQQQAMMRPNISVVLTVNSISVNENGSAIKVSNNFYPLTISTGVSLSALVAGNSSLPRTLSYDKLGRTNAVQITLTGSGNSSGVTATVQVDASGYAYAQ